VFLVYATVGNNTTLTVLSLRALMKLARDCALLGDALTPWDVKLAWTECSGATAPAVRFKT
jgi:hypothetical protein